VNEITEEAGALDSHVRSRSSRGNDGGRPGWLASFATDWRNALLAELDLRLEPVAGLVDALRNEPLSSQA